MSPTLQVERGLTALLEATDGSPFVRWGISPTGAARWWHVDGAVAVPRQRHGRTGLVVLGRDAGVPALLDALPDLVRELRGPGGSSPRTPVGLSVAQHLIDLVTSRYAVHGGGDWEWFVTTDSPVASRRWPVVPLDARGRREEVSGFLARHSPRADVEPGGPERWSAVEDAEGDLLAVGAAGRTEAAAPHLSSIAVRADQRGRGLGRAVVAQLTREAVEDSGVCTLGMYSDNDVARGLYLSLGYACTNAWASRVVTVRA